MGKIRGDRPELKRVKITRNECAALIRAIKYQMQGMETYKTKYEKEIWAIWYALDSGRNWLSVRQHRTVVFYKDKMEKELNKYKVV